MLVYAIKNGFKNLGAKKMFTFASIGTIACSCLIFCIFFSVITNVSYLIHRVETTIGIQVFFDQELNDNQIKSIAENNFKKEYVKQIRFISGDEAWEKFKIDYFEGRIELAEAFADDNPLAHSSSYEILLNDISKQQEYVDYVKEIPGVRQVNYSSGLINLLQKLNTYLRIFTLVLLGILIAISILLISNTISITCEFRKTENEIMSLIGATKAMIRLPYVVEGMFIGFFGAIIPLILISISYNYLINKFFNNYSLTSAIFEPLPYIQIFFPMASFTILISVVVCSIVSFFTVGSHIKI